MTNQTTALTPTAAKILGYLTDNGPATVREIARHHGTTFPHALGALVSLCDAGLVCTEARPEFGWNYGDTRSDPQWRLT